MATKKRKSAGAGAEAAVTYANMLWRNCRPASADAIRSLGAEVEGPLPEALVDLLRAVAGGRPERDYYHDAQYDTEIVIGHVLAVEKTGRTPGILDTLRSMRDVHDVARRKVPFAVDNGNANYLCVDTVDGSVEYWRHDDRKKPFRAVAAGIEELLAGLRAAPF